MHFASRICPMTGGQDPNSKIKSPKFDDQKSLPAGNLVG
jgi:hypothetical protein